MATVNLLWRRRGEVFSDPTLLGSALAWAYLLGENFLKVAMRQPYPGILTFFIWGLLIARLKLSDKKQSINGALV